MDMEKKMQPFDSFSNVNKWLMVAGYCRLYNPRSKRSLAFHNMYRKFVLLLVYVYCLQHVIYVVQVRDDMEKLIEGVILTLPNIFLVVKVSVLYFKSARIDKLVELMKDPIFAAYSDMDEEYMKANTKSMHWLSNIATRGLSTVLFFWMFGPIIKRINDPTTVVSSYMPFKTDTWLTFLLANFLDTTAVVLWAGLGHISIDCAIATYFAQARCQLQIINYNLEHLFDDALTARNNRHFEFIDVLDKNLQQQFENYNKRFEKVQWFTNEVTSIFDLAISIELLAITLSSCLAIFQMSATDTFSALFAFYLFFYMSTQFQIFMFCYYGGLVEHESKLLSDSLYLSEWVAVSPRYRRQLLIAMARWIRPITPKVSGIVPLSLTTFLSLSRSAYTLFTVLKSRNNKTG